jgi:hypothetical protein
MIGQTVLTRIKFFSVDGSNSVAPGQPVVLQFGVENADTCNLYKMNNPSGSYWEQFSNGWYSIFKANVGLGGDFGTTQSKLTIYPTGADSMLALHCYKNGFAAPSPESAISVVHAYVQGPVISYKNTDDAHPGDIVYITGQNFIDRNDVLLDGVVQQTTGSTGGGTKITFLVPANYPTGSTNHQLTIRNENGTSNVSDIRIWPSDVH